MNRTGRRRSLYVLVISVLVASSATPGSAYQRPGATTIVTIADDGRPAYAPLHTPAGQVLFDQHLCRGSDITPDGRYIAFSSSAPLVEGDNNLACDVYVRDLKKERVELVSVAEDGSEAVPGGPDLLFHNTSVRPSISADGRYVAFFSLALNLVSGDTNLGWDTFLRDRKKGSTSRISVDSDENESQAAPCSVSGCTEPLDGPSVSANGHFVAFSSQQPDLTQDDENTTSDVFMRDLREGTTTRIPKEPFDDGLWADGPSLSADGRFVRFGVGQKYVLVYDVKERKSTVATKLVDGSDPGLIDGDTEAWSDGGRQISADGRYVVYVSNVDKFVPSDTNWRTCMAGNLRASMPDVFVFDVKTGRTERVSVSSTGAEGAWGGGAGDSGGSCSGIHTGPSISADGRYVAFGTLTNFAPGDIHDGCDGSIVCSDSMGDRDAYVYDRYTGALTWASPTFDGSNDDRHACDPKLSLLLGSGYVSHTTATALSGSGRYVLMSSCVENLVDGDRNEQWDLFVRDIGLRVGAGTGDGVPALPPDDQLCIDRICLPPLGFLSQQDPSHGQGSLTSPADLIGGRVAFRPATEDVFAVLELEDLPLLRNSVMHATAGRIRIPALLYGLRFTAGGRSYEARAVSAAGGTFGLYDCMGALCSKVADLQGGFGTTGKRIVLSIPLAAIGLGDGGEMHGLEGFTALGTYLTGETKVLDRVIIR